MSIELRRHHIKRVKKARKFYWRHDLDELTGRLLGIVSKTPCICSCWLCSSPKKHTLSIAEIKMFQSGLQEFDLESS